MSGEPARLLPDTDYLLEESKVAMGTSMTVMSGADPLTTPPALGFAQDPSINLRNQLKLEGERTRQMNEAVFLNPGSGWGQIQSFMDNVFKSYKAQNEAQLIKKPTNEKEFIEQAQQMRTVTVDPNELANIRQMAVKLDQQMKAIDPRTSFWTDPRTKKYAEWLNRETGPGEAGFMQSGDQPVEMGVMGRSAYAAWQGIEGMGNATTSLIHGSWDMGRQAILALGGPDVGAIHPTNHIVGPDGKLYNNGGKAPSMMDGIVMMAAAGLGQDIQFAADEAGRAQEWEQANRAGFGGIVTSVSRLGGEVIGMGPAFGAAGAAGKATLGTLTKKGLNALGSLRLTKGLVQSKRALKIIEGLSKGVGEAAGMAAYEATTQGRVEGYGAAYMHGLTMAPVLMTLGALGKKTEWYAQNRVNMPQRAAQAVAGALEGFGFAAVETVAPELLPSAWGFIRDPNQSTFEIYAKNMLSFGLVKMATGRTLQSSPEEMQIRRGIGRVQLAEKVARGEATPEEMSKAPVANEAKLRDLGETSMRARSGDLEAIKRQREIEADLDVEEFGKGPAEESVGMAVRSEESMQKAGERLAGMPKEVQGYPLEILPLEEHMDWSGTHEWIVRDPQTGGVVGTGVIRSDGKNLSIEDADINQAYRGKGIYSSILKELASRHHGNITSRTQSNDAIKAWKRAGIEQRINRGKTEIVGAGGEEGRKLPKLEGDQSSWLSRMVQEGGKEGLEPEKLAAAKSPEAAKEKRVKEAQDPLEDSRFRDLDPEVQKEILAAPDAAIRKQIFHERVVERRVSVDVPRETSREAGQPTELEARQGDRRTPEGARAGPQSLQQQPHHQVPATEGVQQVSAADIFAEMGGRPGRKGFWIPFTGKRIGGKDSDTVRVAVRGGKVGGGGRGVLGVFKFFENLMRTKEGRDLAVGAHEWSHGMHRHTSGQGGKQFVKAAEQQVADAVAADPRIANEMAFTLKDYPGSANMPAWLKWMETWAEWHARNLLGEIGLDQKLPAVSAYMRSWLARPEQARLREQYGRIQEMLYRYNAQGSLGRLEQSIVSGAAAPTETQRATKPGWFSRAKEFVNTALFDDMAALKASQNRWLEAAGRNPEDVSILEDPARLADTIAMTASKTAEYFTRTGIRIGDRFTPGLQSVMDSVKGAEEDFRNFIVAVRNMDLYQSGKEVQLPIQDYVESIRQLTDRHPEFGDAMVKLKAWTDALVDYVAQSGNLSADDAQRIKGAYVVYVPFFRAIEGPKQHGGGRGVAEKGTGLSRIKGSTYEIKDPFIALQQVARSMVAKAHQNQVMTALFKMSVGQEAGGLASIVKRTSVPKDHPLRELLDKIEEKVELPGDKQHELEDVFEALRDADALNPQTVTLFSQKVIPTGERNVIAYTPRLTPEEMVQLVAQGAHSETLKAANNKLQWLEVDTKVYEALMGIDKMPMLPERYQPVMTALRAPGVMLRLFATGINIPFVAANAIRDMMSAPLFDPKGNFRPLGGFIDFWKGAAIYHKNGKLRELFEELGVKTSSFWSEGRQRALIGERQTMWQRARRAIEKVEEIISTPESYIRMSAFRDAYEGAKSEGKTEMEARMLALEAGREITVNFARAGWLARSYNQFTPYFNAGLQGNRKLWGNLLFGGVDSKSDAQRAAIQRGTLINGIVNITVPSLFFWWLHKDEEWYQDLPEWRKIGYINTKIGDQIISIPKPFEAGVLFGGILQIVGDYANDSNPASVKEAMMALVGPYAQVGSVIPAFLKPIIEVSTNTNLYTGRPLTPEWISRSNPPQDQATFYTSETAKILSHALRGILTPTEIEAVAGGYTAGSAVTAMQIVDEISGMKDHPGLAANPFQRFVKQQPHGQSDYVDKLYKLSTTLDQNEDSSDDFDRGFKRRVDTAKKRISDLRKDYRAGGITRAEAERQSYEIARPLIEESRKR
jgi:hypothetical protein